MSTLADVDPRRPLGFPVLRGRASPTPGWPTCAATTPSTGRTSPAAPASGP